MQDTPLLAHRLPFADTPFQNHKTRNGIHKSA
jgi:hypothetical protein